MTFDIERLMRPDIADMPEYTPIVPFEVLSARLGFAPEDLVKLDANENPYGPSPRVRDALAEFPYYAIYPDPSQTLLREAIERYIGVSKGRILCGTGADELIDLVIRLFIGPGEVVINCPPTFGMYEFLTPIARGRIVEVPRRADFSLDLNAIEEYVAGDRERRAKLLFICRPNNPDGSMCSLGDLESVLSLPIVVVVDEAYVEFASDSIVSWLDRYPNLIVLRTFSKWAGLAGLRLGYGLVPDSIVKELWKIKQPYNVNVAAQAAALASLEDVDYLMGNVRRIVAERERLMGLLATVPYLQSYPSQSNFVLCRVRGPEAQHIKRGLEKQGILVRYYRTAALSDCIRISVGTSQQTDRLIRGLLSL